MTSDYLDALRKSTDPRAADLLRIAERRFAAAPAYEVGPVYGEVGLQLITAERQRQLGVEGWDADHDRGHGEEIAAAGATYAMPEFLRDTSLTWPWEDKWWKPTTGDRIRELVKAGALIAAAIDALRDGEKP